MLLNADANMGFSVVLPRIVKVSFKNLFEWDLCCSCTLLWCAWDSIMTVINVLSCLNQHNIYCKALP